MQVLCLSEHDKSVLNNPVWSFKADRSDNGAAQHDCKAPHSISHRFDHGLTKQTLSGSMSAGLVIIQDLEYLGA